MATNYPGSLDSGTQQPSPSSSTEMDDSGFEHDVVHTNHSGAIIALETKVGTGDSNAVASSVLAGTGSGTSGWSTAPSLAGLTVDTNTLHVDATNNRVGIGTTSPGEPLHIVTASSDAYLKQENGTATTFLGPDSSNTGLFGTSSNHDVRFITNNSERLRIDSSGKVGIGTTTPTYNLDVSGNARFTSSATATQFVTNNNGNVHVSLNAAATGNRPYMEFNNWNGSSYVRRGYVGYPNAGSSTATMSFVADNGDVSLYASGGRVKAAPSLQINSGPLLSDPGSANELRVTTAHGYIDIGPKNTSYCHIYTDRTRFYFNKGVDSAPYFYWRNNSGIGGPLVDTSSTSGYRYVLQNQTYGTFFDYTSVRDRKDQITNVTANDSGRWIDALQPVTYIERWLGEGDEPDDARAWREADMQVGFIADDILANSDTDHFSQVLDNGEGGLDPAGWKWECVIAASVAEIKALRARVAELEAA